MILLQSALAAQQRRMGISPGKTGAELLAAVNAAEESDIQVEMIDRDVVIHAKKSLEEDGFVEKWRVLNALLWEKTMKRSHRRGPRRLRSPEQHDGGGQEIAPEPARSSSTRGIHSWRAGYSRFEEREGSGSNWSGTSQRSGPKPREPAMETTSRLAELSEEPPKSVWPIALMAAIPVFLLGAVGGWHTMGKWKTSNRLRKLGSSSMPY